MATLDAKQRAALPNSAFAYVDSKGNRKLPINDEAHVRNALARFNQVRYENEEARERAFRRLLNAASEYGIVPVGFVTSQLRRARSPGSGALPTGPVTLLFSDIEGSTTLVRSLGDGYPPLLDRVRQIIRDAVNGRDGYEVDARADEFFAAFGTAGDAVGAAVQIQRLLAAEEWPADSSVKVRIGIHSGSPARTDTGYVGLPVHVAARVAAAGHGGQVLVTRATADELGGSLPGGMSLESLGSFLLEGLPDSEELLQVGVDDLVSSFPALRATPAG